MKFSNSFISASYKYTTYTEHIPAPLLRKEFSVEKPLDSACLTISGLGFYKLFVNGTEITKGLLAPYISNPDHIVYFDEYDIKPMLKDGMNVIGVILGNGMQNAPGGKIWDFDTAPWRSAPKLALTLECEYSDGEKFEFEADDSFRVSESPIWFDDLRSGVFYDATKEQPGWSEPGFDDSSWGYAHFCERPRGEKRLCQAEPVKINKRIAPVSIKKGGVRDYEPDDRMSCDTPEKPMSTNGHIFDFGINTAGVFEFRIRSAEPGRRIEFFTSEVLDENGDLMTTTFSNFYPKYYAQRDIYICKGGDEVFVPDFTYHGYRYCLVVGLEDSEATAETLTCLRANSAVEEKGGFSCSDKTLNRLQSMVRNSDLSNFYYFPTDCPHREKNGWTGDAALSSEHMLLNLGVENSYIEWLRNIRKTQREDGALPGIIPTGGWGYEWGNGPVWDSALTFIPFYTYKYRGDKRILEENAASILRYVNYISQKQNKKGLVAFGLGDWLHPNRDAGKPKCPLVVTDSITSLAICGMAAFIFNELGMTAQRDFAHDIYCRLRAAIRAYLVDFKRMTVLGDTQTGLAMAIYFPVFEDYEKPRAVKRLVKLIEENNGLLDTGMVGGRYIFHALSDNGYADLAYRMIVGPEFPSYGFWIEKGATSLWESFYPEHLDSLNHHVWGDVSAWFIKAVAGIRINPKCDDTSNLEIRPSFIEGLTSAQAWHASVNGKVSSEWRKDGDTVTVKVSIPQGSYGTLFLPDGWVTDRRHYPKDAVNFMELEAETVVTAVKKK